MPSRLSLPRGPIESSPSSECTLDLRVTVTFARRDGSESPNGSEPDGVDMLLLRGCAAGVQRGGDGEQDDGDGEEGRTSSAAKSTNKASISLTTIGSHRETGGGCPPPETLGPLGLERD